MYYNNGYNNFMNNGFYKPQQYYNQPVQPQQYELPISDIRFLTEDQIKGFILTPNTRVLLIDREKNQAYLETTDMMGNLDKKVFNFNLITDNNNKPIMNEKTQNSINFDNLVTKDDLYLVVAELKTLIEQKNMPAKKNQKEVAVSE